MSKFTKSASLVVVVLAATSLHVTSSGAEQPKMQLIVVSPDGQGFVERDSGRPFIVFGTNYYDPHTGWAPKLWRQFDAQKVRQHFGIMRELGVNCARVFLTAGSFQPNAERVEEQALGKLDRLVEIAGEAGIRLILTGPDHWEGAPSYWRPDRFAGKSALDALQRFWDAVGNRYKGEPTILAWDLLNEPELPWFVQGWLGQWNAWLQKTYRDWDELKAAWGEELTKADKWGDVAVPKNQPDLGNPRLQDWQRFREHLADEWVRCQVEALRRADPTHLITIGYIQWSYPLVRPGPPGRYAAFNPRWQVELLDFVSIHFYPTMGGPFSSQENWQNNLGYLQAVLAYCWTPAYAGASLSPRKRGPVVLGEYGWYGGGAPQQHPYLSEAQQASWIQAEIETSRALADGWLSWPFADTPGSTDMSLFGGLVKSDLTVKTWGHKFKELAANLSELKQPTPELPEFGFRQAFTAGSEDLDKMHRSYVSAIQRPLSKVPKVTPKGSF